MKKADFNYLKSTVMELLKRFASCYRGWWRWHRIYEETGADDYTSLIVIPDDLDAARCALLYLDQFLAAYEYKKAVIVSTSSMVLQCANELSERVLSVKRISKRQEQDLIQFMCLYKFDKRLICASIDFPKGRNGSRLIGKRGVSIEEVFAVGVYGLYPFKQGKSSFL